MSLLFSYGMLQRPDVQQSTFGRLLRGQPDKLVGYEQSRIKIDDVKVVAATGQTHYANIIFNGDNDSRVNGIVYEITDADLAAADQYEQDAAYKRTLVVLASGKKAWVYAAPTHDAGRGADPFDLNRFVDAQEASYQQALSEIRSGQKKSHWMWYIFPQLDGLGFSSISKRYAIRNAAEAEAYLYHPTLGARLVESVEAAMHVQGRSAFEMFGTPDDLKLQSCATLFAAVSPSGSVFEQLLEKYFDGERDDKTLYLLDKNGR
jgi:uncharacterized protein (DUF1810 family)/gamma-glutamylcyclotransferase (GGCT)/AIG2-like uncharacterized protein YtfP